MISIITGCATPQTYNPNNIENHKLATVKTTAGKQLLLSDNYVAWILYIYDSKNNEITKRNLLSTKINEISLPSGEYRLEAECVNKMYSGLPTAVFLLEPSKIYQIYCDVTKDKDFLGITVDSKVQLKIRETE